MLNICFFSGDITRSGGTERVATEIANGLIALGKYRISFLSLVEQKENAFYPISSEIERFVLKGGREWRTPGLSYLPFVPELRRFLKKQNIHIIIDIDIVLDALSLPAVVGLNVKVISWEHFHCYFEQSILYRKLISRLSVRFTDYMVTLTERDKQNYQKVLHRKKKIFTIGNPIDVSWDETVSKEKMLITVGRLEYGKGTDMLAEIIPKVLEKCKGWKWYFLGDGEYRTLLEDVRRRYGLMDRVILTGEVKDVKRYLKRSSIMVFASRSEGLPMSILEARASRVPCVAFDVPVGPAELIKDNVNGFLIPPFMLGSMVEKIKRLTDDEVLRRRFSEAAVAGIEKYKHEEILKKWICLLDIVSDH